jgi:O-antigen/teichoic acid export membrane protein
VLVSWSVPLFALLWFGAPAMAAYLGVPDYEAVFKIAALNAPLMAIYYAYEGILKGRRRFAALSGVQVIQPVIKLLGILVLLLVGVNVAGTVSAHVFASIITVLVAMAVFPLQGRSFSFGPAIRLVTSAVPLTSYSITLVILMNLSLWALQRSLAGTSAEAGFFVASMNLTKVLMVIPATISGVIFVSLSWALANSREALVRKYVLEVGRFVLITLVPMCVALCTDSEAIMLLLYGPQYAGSGPILSLLGLAFGAVALLDVYFFVLMARGMAGRAVAATLILIPLLALLNWLWIAQFGALGAALAAAVALGFGAVLLTGMTRSAYGFLMPGKTVIRVAIAAASMTAVSLLWPTQGWLLLVKLAVMGLVYLAALFATREVTHHDLRPLLIWKADRPADT